MAKELQVADICIEVLENSRRLLEDAKLLYRAKRYRSAISLTVLAAEEIGKIGIMSIEPKDKRKLLDHSQKLLAFAMMVFSAMIEKSEADLLHRLALPDTPEGRQKLGRAIRYVQEDMDGPAYVLYQSISEDAGVDPDGPITGKFVEWFTQQYLQMYGTADGLGDAVDLIGSGLANKLKQHGFYVDVSAKGTRLVDDVEQEVARRWILAVEEMLRSAILADMMLSVQRE